MPSLSPLVSKGKTISSIKTKFVEKIHQPMKFTKTMPQRNKKDRFFDDLDINTTPQISFQKSPKTPSDTSTRNRRISSKSHKKEEENIETIETEDDSQEPVSPKKRLSFNENSPVSKKTPLRKENVLSDGSEDEQIDTQSEIETQSEGEEEEDVDITGIQQHSFKGSPHLSKISKSRSLNLSPIQSSKSPKAREGSPRRNSLKLKDSGQSPKMHITKSPKVTTPTRSPRAKSPVKSQFTESTTRSLRKFKDILPKSPTLRSPHIQTKTKSPATTTSKTPSKAETSQSKSSKKADTQSQRNMETQAGSSRVNKTLKRQRASIQNVEEQPRARRLTRSQVEKTQDIPIKSFMKMLDTTMNATGDADAVFTSLTAPNNQSVIDYSKYATLSKSYVQQTKKDSHKSKKIDFQVSPAKKNKAKAIVDNKAKKMLSQTAPVQASDKTISPKKNQNSTLNKSKRTKRRPRLTMPPRRPSKSSKSSKDDTISAANKSKLSKSKASRGVTFEDEVPPTKKVKRTPAKSTSPRKNYDDGVSDNDDGVSDNDDGVSDNDSMDAQSSSTRRSSVSPRQQSSSSSQRTPKSPKRRTSTRRHTSTSPKKLPTPHPSRSKRKVTELPAVSEGATEETEEEEAELVDHGTVFKNELVKRLRPHIPVKDKDKNIMVTHELSIPPSEVEWKFPKNTSKRDIKIFRAFELPNVTTGQVLIKPGRSKGLQKAKRDAMVFFVVRGLVKVCLEDYEWYVNTGETFLIPEGYQYNLTNQSDNDARLFFVSSRVVTTPTNS